MPLSPSNLFNHLVSNYIYRFKARFGITHRLKETKCDLLHRDFVILGNRRSLDRPCVGMFLLLNPFLWACVHDSVICLVKNAGWDHTVADTLDQSEQICV